MFLEPRLRKTSAVLISFREWLHSYIERIKKEIKKSKKGSHLFQRVASFLPYNKRNNS